MAADYELSVVIPVFNEEKNIGELLKDWQITLQAIPVRYQFIIINDGSTDNSLSILQSIAGQITSGSIDRQYESQTRPPETSITEQQQSGTGHPSSTIEKQHSGTGHSQPTTERKGTEQSPSIVEHRQPGSTHPLAETERRPPISIHTQSNAGHGPSILAGYQLALNTEWVFQIDSDHQHDPAAFRILWENRNRFDFLLGERKEKNATPPRKWVSFSSWLIVRILYGKRVKDVNSPYRLMRCSELKEVLKFIPANTFAPNILLTAWFVYFETRIFTTEISNRSEGIRRQSKMNLYFLRGCFQSIFQTILFRFRL